MKNLIYIIMYLSFLCTPAFPQNNGEIGSQNIINFSSKEYSLGGQNWAIAQAESGIMYFGNTGLLEYDGASWRNYQVPSKTTIRSMEFSDNGKLYAGAVGDLGYFIADSIGGLTFHSLAKYIPENKRDFSDVWETHVLGDKVYFAAANYIFIWDSVKKEFKVLESEEGFHLSFKNDGKIYVREWGKGLEVFENDIPVLVPGGEKFANERIYVMLPFPGEKGTYLVVTRTMGMFKYNGKDFIPFKTEADQFLKDNRIYLPGSVLSDDNFLLGTLSGGAVIIDTKGKLISTYNTATGIIDNNIEFTYQDSSGAIWLGTSKGISRIDYSSSISYFDQRNDLSTNVHDIIRYKGTLYVAANGGVYYLNQHTSKFQLLNNSGNQSWSFYDTGNELLIGTFDGLFKLDNNRLTAIKKSIGNKYIVSLFKHSKFNSNRIYIGTSSGVWSIIKKGNNWVDDGQILNISDNILSIIEDDDGSLWAGTIISGVYKINFKKDEKGNISLKDPSIEHFEQDAGLEEGTAFTTKFFGENYFFTNDSVYKFNSSNKMFYQDTSDLLVSEFYKYKKNNYWNDVEMDSTGRLWISVENKIAMGTRNQDGTYNWISSPFNRFADESIQKIYSEDNGVTWFALENGLIKYDFLKTSFGGTKYSALVRKVDIGDDSTVYLGGRTNHTSFPEFSFDNNSVKFRFSATSYEGKNINKFQTYLEGFDERWSNWTRETVKEYTNLPPGKYTFNVTALNILGVESSPGKYSFEILPPIYRTWWAYGFYVILLGLLVFTTDRMQRRRLIIKERRRSHIKEMELRAEAAESETKALQAENERKKNVEMLSEIGKEITATLDLDAIFYKLYEHVNQLADASVFGVGIYHYDREEIEYRLAIEKGKRYPVYSRDIKDKNQFPVWCVENRKPVFINDVTVEYKNYIDVYKVPDRLLEDGTKSDEPLSIIYLPLMSKDKLLGVITIQSFEKNAYTDYHLNILQNLASYTSIALDNADAYRSLQSTQNKLVTQEKLASLGALTAGIAHEIKNPLNFINNFSDLSAELLEELKEEFKNNNTEEVLTIANDLKQNLEKINQHGKRADSIVKSMLLHSRGNSGEKTLTDINDLLDQYVALAYHGLRAQNKSFNVKIEKDFDSSLDRVNVVPQDIGRVFLNIINNACYAAYDKKKKSSEEFSPILKVSTRSANGNAEIVIADNGNGIPEEIVDKIFQPFFTTKPTGEGTGLGLSLSYDIVVKIHGGELKVNTKLGNGSEFIIQLPMY